MTYHTRITRDSMLAQIVGVVAQRSTCLRARVGSLIAREGRILSIGYAGSPSGSPHCQDAGCLIGPEGGCIRTIHAEANAIAFAAKSGISLDGAELWCSYAPCLSCAKLLINSGIRHVHYLTDYRIRDGSELLMACGIPVTQYGGD